MHANDPRAQASVLLFRRRIDRLDDVVRRAVTPVLERLVDREFTNRTRELLAEALFPAIEQARDYAHDFALEAYAAQSPDDTAPDVETPRLFPVAITKGLRTPEGRLNPDLVREVLVRQVEQGGRDTIIKAVNADAQALGWARIDTNPPGCAFCTMLIARGPKYKSKLTAGFEAHYRDQCVAVPVFDKDAWVGREQHHHARRLWIEVTRGLKGKEKLREMRRELRTRGVEAEAA